MISIRSRTRSPAAQLAVRHSDRAGAALAAFLDLADQAGVRVEGITRRQAKPAPVCTYCGGPVGHVGLVVGSLTPGREQVWRAVSCAACARSFMEPRMPPAGAALRTRTTGPRQRRAPAPRQAPGRAQR